MQTGVGTAPQRGISLCLSVDRITKLLFGLIAGLVVAGVAGQIADFYFGRALFGFVREFDLDGEANIPSYFSALCLLACSLLLFAAWRFNHQAKDPYRWHWLVLALGFLWMSFDEAALLHENAGRIMRRIVNPTGFYYFPWLIVGAPVALVAGVAYLRFLSALPSTTRRRFVVAGVVYILGVIVVESLGAKHYQSAGRDFLFALISAAEETLEMAGAVLFLRALGLYLASLECRVSISFAAGNTGPRVRATAAG